ncbi:PREDICTED: uncharacterized protein LOC106302626 [Brassica oleracea var. oleracea]|uniref:uncharacterized protein LOC106302626 n=1 Tax=Brassica oleracea var. oleracea TaxID=109376 RepID=UPI0006A74376|nr:PREDICTED: uncharacterized protein LOC106302626 [Brassica oleracea var. oleracea]
MRKDHYPDFLFLMETKQKDSYMIGLQKTLGYDRMFTVSPEGLSRGLAVLWKDCYKVEILPSDKRLIDMSVEMGSLFFFLSCIYGDPVRDRRQLVWDKLVNIGLTRDRAWALIGDFNELLDNSEKLGRAFRNDSTFWDFRNMVENCKIKEVRSTGNSLSWVGWRDNVWVECRLDRSFGNDEWFQLFPRSNVNYMEMWPSDHRPLLLKFVLEPHVRGRGHFYFDKRMVGNAGFEDAVRRGWDGGTGDNSSIMDHLSSCRKELSWWKRSSELNFKTRIQRLNQELEKEIAKIRPSARSMRRLRVQIAQAHRDEERYWRKRSREQWLREGAKGDIAVGYFRDLFMSSNSLDLESLFKGFQGKVTEDMNVTLTKEFTPEEIKRAAFSIRVAVHLEKMGSLGVISDNIIVAHEMVHGLRTNNSVNEKFMAIKTDMSKACDRVEWNFL